MPERLNLVDCYDLACVKDELERKIICQYNNDISPIKKSLQLHKQRLDVKDNQLSIIKEQITGLGEIVIMLSNEIDDNKEKAIESNRKTNFDKTRIDNLLFNRTKRLTEKIDELEELIKEQNNKFTFMIIYYIFLFVLIIYFWSF